MNNRGEIVGINCLLYNTSKTHFSKKNSSMIRNKHNICFLKTRLTLTEHCPQYVGMKVKKCFTERATIYRSLKTAKLDKKEGLLNSIHHTTDNYF